MLVAIKEIPFWVQVTFLHPQRMASNKLQTLTSRYLHDNESLPQTISLLIESREFRKQTKGKTTTKRSNRWSSVYQGLNKLQKNIAHIFHANKKSIRIPDWLTTWFADKGRVIILSLSIWVWKYPKSNRHVKITNKSTDPTRTTENNMIPWLLRIAKHLSLFTSICTFFHFSY